MNGKLAAAFHAYKTSSNIRKEEPMVTRERERERERMKSGWVAWKGKGTSGTEREREETTTDQVESGGEATGVGKQPSGSERERGDTEVESSGPEANKWKQKSGTERERGESTEVEIMSSGPDATKGREEQTSGSERDQKGKRIKEKKKDRRRAKLFKESTARLHEVRSLDMAMQFKPLPNQHVILEVPEDVDVREFASIAHFADHKGYAIHNEREMMKLMLKRFENMVVRKVEPGEEGDEPGRGAPGSTSGEGGQQHQQSTQSTSYSPPTDTGGSSFSRRSTAGSSRRST